MIGARRLLAALLLALGIGAFLSPAPARADDIAAASRSVVRVVTIAIVDQEVVGFGHGSGFAVGPNRIWVETARRWAATLVPPPPSAMHRRRCWRSRQRSY